MKPSLRRKPSVFLFIAIAVVLMLGVEFFVMKGDRPYYYDEAQDEGIVDVTAPVERPETAEIDIMGARGPVIAFVQEQEEEPVVSGAEVEGPREQTVTPPTQWRRNAVAAPAVPDGFARVVVIIDDLGVDRKRSQAIIDLPGPLTTAFLPYALNVEPMVVAARAQGHEIMIHMPMEPMGEGIDMGGVALRSGMEPAAFDAMLAKAFTAFEGYVGMNNHMGSKLTQDRGAMERLMARLYENGLLFVDSRTIGGSVAEHVAADHNVPHTGRDVFLDHDPDYAGVMKSLEKVEQIARREGVAVAIGHPKTDTIRALAEWLPTLHEKKLVLVPVSAVVTGQPEPVRDEQERFTIAPDEDAAALADW